MSFGGVLERTGRAWACRVAAAAFLAAASLVWAQPAGPLPTDPLPSGPLPSDALPSDADWTRDPAARARLFDRVQDRLRDVHVDPSSIDWSSWRSEHRSSVVAADGRAALDGAFRRAFAALGDDHSRWIGRPVGDASGRGTPPDAGDLGIEGRPLERRGLLVTRVHPGGAAEHAGLERGDVVVAADGATLGTPGLGRSMRARIATALRDGSARLDVERRGAPPHVVEVASRPLPTGARERPIGELDPRSRVARLEVPAFVPGTAEDVHAEVARLAGEGARGLVLDLRGNRGGSVVEMGLVLALLVDGEVAEAWAGGRRVWSLEVAAGPPAVARLVHRTGPYAGTDLAAVRLGDAVRWTGPVAVLVDEGTESAAEVLAGVLLRQVGAPVVGAETPGNVETVRRIAFPGGNAAWVAVADVRAPGGAPLAPVSVDADVRLEPEGLARGHDAPFAEAARRLLDLPIVPGRWF